MATLDQGPDLSWAYSPTLSYGLEPVENTGDWPFRGNWYTDDGGLRITVGTRELDTRLIHGTDDRSGLHCEWEAALLEIHGTTFATTGAHVITKRSDPQCRSASVPYDYTLHGSGATTTLIRHSNAETATLRLERHP
ncbi:hypothetical protein [Streptomyces sp. NPDC002671]